MKYNEQHVQQLITTVQEYQLKLKKYNHKDIDQYLIKLNKALLYVILSVVYNNHLPSTILTTEQEAREYIEDILGKEVMTMVGLTDKEWLHWINKSVLETQRFPFNIINKIKRLFTK